MTSIHDSPSPMCRLIGVRHQLMAMDVEAYRVRISEGFAEELLDYLIRNPQLTNPSLGPISDVRDLLWRRFYGLEIAEIGGDLSVEVLT